MNPDNDYEVPVDTLMILLDAQTAIKAIKKNSKLREHYLKLSMMNNIMRAFVYMYQLEPQYKQTQEALLKVLLDVEGRKNRAWFKSDLAVLDSAYILYDELLGNATDAQLQEIMEFVAYNREQGKWCVHHDKNGKMETSKWAIRTNAAAVSPN